MTAIYQMTLSDKNTKELIREVHDELKERPEINIIHVLQKKYDGLCGLSFYVTAIVNGENRSYVIIHRMEFENGGVNIVSSIKKL